MMGLSTGPASGVSNPPLDNVLSVEPGRAVYLVAILRWAAPAGEAESRDPAWLF
jgi:hypothetical protein